MRAMCAQPQPYHQPTTPHRTLHATRPTATHTPTHGAVWKRTGARRRADTLLHDTRPHNDVRSNTRACGARMADTLQLRVQQKRVAARTVGKYTVGGVTGAEVPTLRVHKGYEGGWR